MGMPSKEAKVQSIKAFEALDSIFESKEPVKPVARQTPNGPDLSKIIVPNSLVEQVTGKKVEVKEVKREKVVEVKTESKLSDLILRLSSLLAEAKQLMSEMTTVGSIGTNQKFAVGTKKPNKMQRYVKLFKKK